MVKVIFMAFEPDIFSISIKENMVTDEYILELCYFVLFVVNNKHSNYRVLV